MAAWQEEEVDAASDGHRQEEKRGANETYDWESCDRTRKRRTCDWPNLTSRKNHVGA